MKSRKTPTKHLLLLDNYDSFTYNLYDYLLQLGATCTVVRHDAWPISQFLEANFDGMVLSPGPKAPNDAGNLMEVLQTFQSRLPILGICLGHQAIGQLFGAQLVRAPEPVHGKTSLVYHRGHPLFEGISSPFEVMRYHSLILQNFSDTPIREIAHTADGISMAIAHRELPLWGVQFHPESIGTPQGLRILQNWLLQV
ncbi:MAG: aminodeoxychorismate/anthranilate synthase component II [Saprospiraceae bacterium]|nr:aminodeoxychorismate/anthranilate synthase component II [Saprospiraceae bacterium]